MITPEKNEKQKKKKKKIYLKAMEVKEKKNV